jgi:hypothetical protein
MLPINLAVTGISATRLIADIEVQVKDEYKQLVYTPKVEPLQVPISFVGMPPSTQRDITLVDNNESPTGMEIVENSWLTRVPRRTTHKNFSLPTREALITDVVNLDLRGQPVPLYFRHNTGDTTLSNPRVLDIDGAPVRGDKYKIVIEEGEIVVFHDLRPVIDYENLRTKAYYVSYTKTDGTQVYSLLESEPAFKRITLADNYSIGGRYYVSSRGPGFFEHDIITSGAGPFYLRVEDYHQLKLQKPLMLNPTEAWNISISDGEVFAANADGSNLVNYSIPEYHLQNWAPFQPLKLSGTVECLPITNRLVKLPVFNVVGSYKIEVLLTEKSLNPIDGWTTSSGPNQNWVDRFERIVAEGTVVSFPLASFAERGLSINKEFGLLSLPLDIPFEGRVFVRCKYEAKQFKYSQLNVNPIHNRRLQTEKAVIYCWPKNGGNDPLRSIYHFYIDNEGNITDWNDSVLGEDELIGELDPTEDTTAYEQFKLVFPGALILGLVGANRSASPLDLTYIDIRERGGVLRDDIKRDLPSYIEQIPELQWIEEDSVSGRSIPMMSSFIAKVPYDLLEEAGGPYTRDSLLESLSRHVQLGGAPIVEYYDTKSPKLRWAELDDEENLLIVYFDQIDESLNSYPLRLYYSEDSRGYSFTEELEFTLNGNGYMSISTPIETNADSLSLYITVVEAGNERPRSNLVRLDLTVPSDHLLLTMGANIIEAPTTTLSLEANIY